MKLALLLAALLLLLAALAFWTRSTPSHQRRWSADQSVLPRTEFAGDSVTVYGVRDFRWSSDTVFQQAWEDRSYNLGQVATAWYVLVPFTHRWRGPAHAFVSFGFDDGRYLAISVEARREAGETYGILKGLLHRFELMYVVGDERDLIGRRVLLDSSEVYLYPIRASREDVRTMFTQMLERTNEIYQRPEWYNSLTNNCTMSLVRHVNRIAPGRIPTSWRIVLPGYSDQVVHTLGLMDSTLPLDQARARFRITDKARAALDSAEFSRVIRE